MAKDFVTEYLSGQSQPNEPMADNSGDGDFVTDYLASNTSSNGNGKGLLNDLSYQTTSAVNTGLAGLARTGDVLFGDGKDGAFIQRLDENAAYAQSQLSPRQQQANQKQFFSDQPGEFFGEAWADPRKYSGIAADALGSMIPIVMTGGPLSAGLKTAGLGAAKKLGVEVAAKNAAGKMALTKAGERISSTAGALGYGLPETAMVTGSVSGDIRRHVNEMPKEVLSQSPRYQELRSSGLDDIQARGELGRELGIEGMKDVALPSLLLGTVAGKYLDSALTGKLPGNPLYRGTTMAGVEGTTEAGQGGSEQLVKNLRLGQVDPTVTPLQGVGEAAFSEGIGGGMLGGAGGAISPNLSDGPLTRAAKDVAPTTAIDPNVIDEANQLLNEANNGRFNPGSETGGAGAGTGFNPVGTGNNPANVNAGSQQPESTNGIIPPKPDANAGATGQSFTDNDGRNGGHDRALIDARKAVQAFVKKGEGSLDAIPDELLQEVMGGLAAKTKQTAYTKKAHKTLEDYFNVTSQVESENQSRAGTTPESTGQLEREGENLAGTGELVTSAEQRSDVGMLKTEQLPGSTEPEGLRADGEGLVQSPVSSNPQNESLTTISEDGQLLTRRQGKGKNQEVQAQNIQDENAPVAEEVPQSREGAINQPDNAQTDLDNTTLESNLPDQAEEAEIRGDSISYAENILKDDIGRLAESTVNRKKKKLIEKFLHENYEDIKENPHLYSKHDYSNAIALKSLGRAKTINKSLAETSHKLAVKNALESGKQIPDAILKEYPDLYDRHRTPTIPATNKRSHGEQQAATGTGGTNEGSGVDETKNQAKAQATSEKAGKKRKSNLHRQPSGLEELQKAIGKLGGIRKTDHAGRAGFSDYKGRKYQRTFNDGANSKTLDEMAEALRQYGWDLDGENALIAALSESMNGREQYTPAGHEKLMETMEREGFDQEEAEVFNGFDDYDDLTADDFDAAINSLDEIIEGKVLTGQEAIDSLNEFFGITDEQETSKESSSKVEEETLTAYTEEEIRDRAQRQKDSDKREAELDKKAEEKRKADLEVDTLADEMLGTGGTTTNDIFDLETKSKAPKKKKTTAPKKTESGIKLKQKQVYAFSRGIREGAEASAIGSNDPIKDKPSIRAIQAGFGAKKYEKDAFVAGFNLGSKYQDDWRDNKNLLNKAIQNGDVTPVDFEYTNSRGGGFGAEPKLSQSTKTKGSTKEQLTELIRKRYKEFLPLLQAGKIKIVSLDELPEKLKDAAKKLKSVVAWHGFDDADISITEKFSAALAGTEGLFDPKTGTTYVIKDFVNEDTLGSVLNHEAFHRLVASDPVIKEYLIGSQSELAEIFNLIKEGKYKGRYKTLYEAAQKRIPDNTPEADIINEFGAYSLSLYNQGNDLPARLKRWAKELIARIKRALRGMGVKVSAMTPADLQLILKSSLAYDAEVSESTDVKPSTEDVKLSVAGMSNEELNKRIREEHKTISDKAKTWLKREFLPGGLLPKKVFDLKITRDSEMNATELDAHNLVAGLERAVQNGWDTKYDDLTDEQADLITKRLQGKEVDLPDSIKDRVDAMRLYIDKLSLRYANTLFEEAKELAENDQTEAAAAKVALLNTIAGNVGQYVNRSYRAFDDEGWFKKVPEQVLNDARAYFESKFTGSEDPKGDAQRVMNDIIKTGTAYDTFAQYIKESKLGAKDLSTLKHKKQIAPEVRALLGEYTDARINFVKSATKMSRLVFNDDFLKQVKESGMDDFLFTKDNRPSDEHTVQIAADSNSGFAPLNGLYTYPEVNQAFIDALNKENMESWYRMIVQANGMVKFGKTVLSPTTSFRNWMSAFFFSMANSHFDMSHVRESVESFQTYFDRDDGRLEYLRKLKKLGVIYDTPYAGEMMKLLEDSRFEAALMDTGEKTKLDKAKLKIKDWMDIATKFYQFGDDFWKIIGFENEKRILMKYREMSEADAEVEAAKRIRDTYPTYSMVGRMAQKLRRFPLAGTFVSFPAEIIRTSFNMLKYAKEDMAHSKELGRRRIAGLSLVSGFAFAAQEMAKQMVGMDDDEEEALRDLAPPWSKNSNIIPVGRDKDGSIRYIDLSFLDPYNYWKRPINAILRDEPVDEKVYEVGRELLTPFFGRDIAFGALTDIWQNKKESGGRVFNPNDSTVSIGADIANHLRKNLQPGAFSNIERMSDAITGYKSTSGRTNKVSDELAALMGFRTSTLNPKVALYYRAFEFQDKLRDASRILSDKARNPNKVSQSELKSAYERARATRSEAFKDMHELVNAAKKSGLSTGKIRQLLKLNRISQKNIGYIMQGKEPQWRPSKRFLQSSIKRADDFFDSSTKKEFIERRSYVLSK